MANRGEIGKRRREQIIEAAVAIITEQGLPELSLSAIEQKAGMSRGQLTYYFPTKEDILLAVFDRMLEMMHGRMVEVMSQRVPGVEPEAGSCALPGTGWERLQSFLSILVLHPPQMPEFYALQYTFLSQIGHRDDFRQRLASLYEDWRKHMAGDFSEELPSEGKPPVSARTLASFVQALLHGLAIQRVADHDSYDRQEMLTLCLDLLGSYLHGRSREGEAREGEAPAEPPPSAAPDETNHSG